MADVIPAEVNAGEIAKITIEGRTSRATAEDERFNSVTRLSIQYPCPMMEVCVSGSAVHLEGSVNLARETEAVTKQSLTRT